MKWEIYRRKDRDASKGFSAIDCDRGLSGVNSTPLLPDSSAGIHGTRTRYADTRSMTSAIPWPTPMHRLTIA